MDIQLTIKQRLELMWLIDEKCRGTVDDKRRKRGEELLSKIEIPEGELPLYVVDVPGIVRPVPLSHAVKRAESTPKSFDLTSDEAGFLLNLIVDPRTGEEAFKNLGPRDHLWLEPMQKALQTIAQQS